MKRSITAPLVAIVLIGGMAVPAMGEMISGTLTGDSTLTPTGTPGVYVQNFTGDGDDVKYGAFTPSSTSSIDFSDPPHILISNGTFLETFLDGTLFGTTSGSGTANGQGSANVTIDFVFTDGTGHFAGDTGTATFTGTISSTGPTTESITGSYQGTLSSVPEPNTLALLTPVATVTVLLRRRRNTIVNETVND